MMLILVYLLLPSDPVPRVQAVVYCTRSILDPENENVVTRSLEYVNMVQQKKTPYRIAPPVIPLSDRDIEMENPLNGKYLRYPPSNLMSGCFIATITREVCVILSSSSSSSSSSS